MDKTLKKALYETRFRTPEYFWFSPETLEIEGYRLVNQAYETIVPDEVGFWSQVLGLYLGVRNGQLRYLSEDGELTLTPGEAAHQAQIQAHQAQTLSQESETRANQLAEQLRRLGIEPEA